jgi:protein SCO1/2
VNFIRLFLGLATFLTAHAFEGKVLGPDSDGFSLKVQSADATERTFRVGPGDYALGWAGRPVKGEVVVSDGKERLERIFPIDSAAVATIAATAAALRRDTVERGRLVARGVGDNLPPFALWDHDGKLVTTADLNGKPTVFNFIFTRCKAAEMCPASTAAMVTLGSVLRQEGLGEKVRLVTLTFDPGHDSPGVLRTYGQASGAQLAQHRFLTGDRGMMRDLMRQFGIAVLEQDGTLVHNAATVVVSADGRILARLPGARFEPETLLPVLRRTLTAR